MRQNCRHTHATNLSAIEALLDARANQAGNRTARQFQSLQQVVVEGIGRSLHVVKPGETITVGRSDECDIVLAADNRISRLHCSIACTPLEALLRDLQSTNGTYLNGQRVSLAKLMDRDRILIGATVFFIRIEGALDKLANKQ